MDGLRHTGHNITAPFSICYSPENGYCASKGESLNMKLEIVPDDGFREPVDVKIRIRVPDPAVGIFTIYNQVHDLGVHSYPYTPMCFTQALDPDNPPEGYEFIKKAYAAAKKMKIDAVDVHVDVTASGGGFVREEKPVYRVNF
ncbi:conserved hypothetical protein [Methanolacinia petrolearia DSM 11571]|uniref:Uncharacterized protein n=1 Tax=Methanolacinia petrolearia (strain DSM 11571 / OCM 486 / SEBR 4847) TaxID=679926 RepID=E1RD50_METP4|nr:hypothetical protein [Methanolacinia petrolearia]ADN37033.1 conserved hypothetical protein [Methanolacinia petrolearia DSM 11571]